MATVGAVTVIEMAGGPRLELPAEPVALRDGLREALLAGHDWHEGLTDDIRIGVWLWRQWQPALEPIGIGRDEFVDMVTAYRRELWLWLIGDRVWDQCIAGLAGRIVRRANAASSGSD